MEQEQKEEQQEAQARLKLGCSQGTELPSILGGYRIGAGTEVGTGIDVAGGWLVFQSESTRRFGSSLDWDQ